MLIDSEKVLRGESWQQQLQENAGYYNEQILEVQKEMEYLFQQGESESEKLITELCEKPVEDYTPEEKQVLYDYYKQAMQKINNLLGAFGGKQEEIPPFESVDDEMLEIYKIFVKTEHSPLSEKIEDCKKRIRDYENTRDNFAYLKVSKETFFNDTQKVEELCKEIIGAGKQLKVVVYDNMVYRNNNSTANYVYTKDEFNTLVEFNIRLRELGMQENIRINEFNEVSTPYDYNRSWDLKTVLEANNSIDKIVEFIKSKQLTPYEAMLYIHRYITSNYAYKHGDHMHENVIMGAFTDKSIICSGYASLTKAIIDKLGYPELKCDLVGCKIYKDGLIPKVSGAHCQCLVHIKDEAYGINGTYLNDTCWDSKMSKYPKGRGFANCMLPLSDSMHFKNTIYVQLNETSRYDTLIINIKEFKNALKNNSKLSDIAYRTSLKFKKPVPEYISKYESKPIEFDTFKKGLQTMVRKIAGPEKVEQADELVDKIINDTMFFASVSFDNKANNAYARYVRENNLKFDKQAQQTAEQNQNQAVVKE